MSKYFDEQKWSEAIQHDDWYLRLSDDYKRLMKQAEESSKEISEKIKEEIYQFFENHLEKGDIALGKKAQTGTRKESRLIPSLFITPKIRPVSLGKD